MSPVCAIPPIDCKFTPSAPYASCKYIILSKLRSSSQMFICLFFIEFDESAICRSQSSCVYPIARAIKFQRAKKRFWGLFIIVLDQHYFLFSSRWKAKRILTAVPAMRWLKREIPTAAHSKLPLTRSMLLLLLFCNRAYSFFITFAHCSHFRKAHITLYVVLAHIARMESKRLNNLNIWVLNFLKKYISKF